MDKVSPLGSIISYFSLSSADSQLLDQAVKAMELAYAPYSGFHVGAALRLENGQIIIGANQENASYPLCICGERVAIYNSAVNAPEQKILTLAIVARNQAMVIDKPVSPCGACRQVISEFENKQKSPIRILLKGDSDKVMVFNGIKELLPFSFDRSYLSKKP